MTTSYTQMDAALNELAPIRQHRARELYRYLGRHRKHVLSGSAYQMIIDRLGIPAWGIDQAIDDLWAAGLLTVRVVNGLAIVAPVGMEGESCR